MRRNLPAALIAALIPTLLAATPLAACKPKEAPKAPAPKQAPLPAADTFAGVYVFEGSSPDPAPCTITLAADAIPDAPDAHPAAAGPGCTVQHPMLVPLARWEVVAAATIRFTDKDGFAMGDFSRAGEGPLTGTGEADAKPFTLTPLALWMRKPASSPAPAAPAPAPEPAPTPAPTP